MSIGRLARGTCTAQIERQDTVVAAEIRDLPLPEARCNRPARKQENRLASTMVLVIQRQAIGPLQVGHRDLESRARHLPRSNQRNSAVAGVTAISTASP